MSTCFSIIYKVLFHVKIMKSYHLQNAFPSRNAPILCPNCMRQAYEGLHPAIMKYLPNCPIAAECLITRRIPCFLMGFLVFRFILVWFVLFFFLRGERGEVNSQLTSF